MAVLNGVPVGLAYMGSQGNITATIVWFTITTGATAGLSYYKEKELNMIRYRQEATAIR